MSKSVNSGEVTPLHCSDPDCGFKMAYPIMEDDLGKY